MKIGREPIVTSCPQAPPYRVGIPPAPVDRRHSSAQDPLGLLGSPDAEPAFARAVSLPFRHLPAPAPLHFMATYTLKCYRTYADGGERVLGYGSLSLGSSSPGTATHESTSAAVEFRRARFLRRWSHCMEISGKSTSQSKLAMRRRVIAPLANADHETVRRPFAALAARGGMAVTGCPVDIISVAALQGAWRSPHPAKRSAEAARLHRVPASP